MSKDQEELERIFNLVYDEGVEAFQSNRYALAEPVFRMLTVIAPTHPGLNAALGHIYLQSALTDEAIHYFEIATESNPNNEKYWGNLGAALIRKGRMDDAKECFGKALEIDPNYTLALSNLGHVYRAHGMHDESMKAYYRAYELEPDNHAYIVNVANAYQGMGQFEKSLEWLEWGISKDKEGVFPEYWNNLGNVFNKLGDVKAAKEAYQKMLDKTPNISAAANKVLVNLYDPDVTPEHQRKEAEESMKVLNKIHRIQLPEYNHDRPRVGFMSAHFGKHPVGFFTAGLFKANKSNPYYVYCNRYDPDDVTEVIQENSIFKNVHGWSEEQLCRQILEDEIDILIDCGGLSGKNAIKIFKRKPAPVQVGWVGFAGTRGVKEIDYLISDWNHTPRGDELYFTEQLLRFSEDYVTYYPNLEFPIERRDGPVTFIAAHNSCKLNKKMFELWAEILKRVPDSRLIMAYKGLRSNTERIISSLGVDPTRVEIHDHLPHNEMMDMYNDADVMLDTWPYSAGLVVCESLWMGVPVVTLPSRMYSGRHAVSHLKAAGMDWGVAKDERDYIEKAVALAKPLDTLARQQTRVKLTQSPLMDYDAFAAEFNAKMEEIWK